MTTILLVVLAILLAVFVWRYLAEQPHGKHKDRREIADALIYLLRLMENGGKLRAVVVDSEIALVFERSSGDDSRAIVVMSVEGEPDPSWAQGLHARFRHPVSEDGPTLLIPSGNGGIGWEVDDIWADACVAPIVSVVWRVLDSFEVPQAATIDFSLEGPRSGRWLRNLRGKA